MIGLSVVAQRFHGGDVDDLGPRPLHESAAGETHPALPASSQVAAALAHATLRTECDA